MHVAACMLPDQRGPRCLLATGSLHTPGVDPTKEQWQGILKVVQEKKLLPFFDSAYQVRWLCQG